MLKRIKDDLFIFIIGIIYYLSLHGIAVGDHFFKSFEVGYPLFLSNEYMVKSHWYGFLAPHFLNYPTLRFIQIILAKLGFLPLPLIMFQAINLVLSLLTLKLIYSALLRLDLNKFMAKATTVLFAFSFGFYSNMNAEFHHFSIFFIAAYIWLLVYMEKEQSLSKGKVFLLFLCLALAPLYHIENIIYSGCIVLYTLFNRTVWQKIRPHLFLAVSGLLLFPLFLVICAFCLHYYDFGKPGLGPYISYIPEMLWFKRFGSMAESSYTHFSLMQIYIMLRAFFESFSIVSRVAKVAQHYKDIVFYSGPTQVMLTIIVVFTYCLLFLLTLFRSVQYFITNWKNISSVIRLLTVVLIIFLVGYGIFMNLLLSEFYITAAMFSCIVLGYVFNSQSKPWKGVYLALVGLTVVTNIFLYALPQKISAISINRICDQIQAQNPGARISVFRVSFMNLPDEIEKRKDFKVYYDEYAYSSRENSDKYLDDVKRELKKGNKVFLISAGFLFGKESEVNISTVVPMAMDENPELVKNLAYFIDCINKNYDIGVVKEGYFNFGTLGQLGKIAVVQIKRRLK